MKTRERMRILKSIAELENIRPHSLDELVEKTDISRATICRYRQSLRQVGVIKKRRYNPDSKWYLLSTDHFRELDIISEYKEQLQINKLSVTANIAPLFKICQTLGVHPDEFKESVNKSEVLYTKFVSIWRKDDDARFIGSHDKAIRNFLKFLGFETKGRKPFFIDKTVGGVYANIRLTDTEFENCLQFMEREGGSEYRNLFGIHHETFVRPATLFKPLPRIEMQFMEESGRTIEYAQLSVVESKQGIRYDKLILHPKVLEVAVDLPFGKPIVSDKKVTAEKKYADLLRLFYTSIGKIEEDVKYQSGNEQWIYQTRPLYTIRHSSAHMWMRRTNYNADLVASMGWEDSKTLLKYYSRVSTKSIMSAGMCQFCKPPLRDTGEYSFCSATHATAYLNGLRKNA